MKIALGIVGVLMILGGMGFNSGAVGAGGCVVIALIGVIEALNEIRDRLPRV